MQTINKYFIIRYMDLVLRTENPYANISGYFPDCTSSEYSAQPAAPPFLNLHTQKNILENLHRNFKFPVDKTAHIAYSGMRR